MQASLLDFSVADPFHLGEVTARTNVYRSCIVNDDRPTADNIERERNAKNGPQGLLLADRQSRSPGCESLALLLIACLCSYTDKKIRTRFADRLTVKAGAIASKEKDQQKRDQQVRRSRSNPASQSHVSRKMLISTYLVTSSSAPTSRRLSKHIAISSEPSRPTSQRQRIDTHIEL